MSFRAHQTIAVLDDADWRRKILTWAATPLQETGRLPTIRDIEEQVKQARAFLAQGWTEDQLARKARSEAGVCVASIREAITVAALMRRCWPGPTRPSSP